MVHEENTEHETSTMHRQMIVEQRRSQEINRKLDIPEQRHSLDINRKLEFKIASYGKPKLEIALQKEPKIENCILSEDACSI